MPLCGVSRFIYFYAEYRYAEFLYATFHNAKCRYAECRFAECRGTLTVTCTLLTFFSLPVPVAIFEPSFLGL